MTEHAMDNPGANQNTHQKIAKNNSYYTAQSAKLPGLWFQAIVFSLLFGLTVPVEVLAVFLTYKMSFEGQDELMIMGLSLQAVASIGALHMIKKMNDPQIDLWIKRIAICAFICFALGFGFIAATTSLKELLINLLPDLGSSSIGPNGLPVEGDKKNIISSDAFAWLIPYAWYFAFTGLTLVMAFAAAELLDRIMKLFAEIFEIRTRVKSFKRDCKELDEVCQEIDAYETLKQRWDEGLFQKTQNAVNTLLHAYEKGLSEGPRKLVQILSSQSPNTDTDHHNTVLIPSGKNSTTEINIRQFEQDLKKAESSCDPKLIADQIKAACQIADQNNNHNSSQLPFDFKDKE